MKTYRKGFTLIELLVVIAIISLLSSIVMSSLNSARMKGRDVARVSYIRQIQTGLELYYDENGKYPTLFPPGSMAYLTTTSGDVGWSDLANSLKPYIANLPTELTPGGYLYKATNSGQKYGMAVWLESSSYFNLTSGDRGSLEAYYEVGLSPSECWNQTVPEDWWNMGALFCP